MTKRRSPDPPSPDFKHTPFKTLKGIAVPPAPARKPAQPHAAKSRKRPETEDDAEAFLRAVDGARKINRDEDDTAPIQRGVSPGNARPQQSGDLLFTQAMKKIGTTFPIAEPDEDELRQERRPSSGRMKQLRRGTIRISDELDLHGYLKEEALSVLASFLSAARSRGLLAVLIITGKGINSPEGPVLQGAVADWLRTKGKGIVAEFGPAPRERGGSGAYVVFLKK